MRCSVSRPHSAAGELSLGEPHRESDSLPCSYSDRGSSRVHHKGLKEAKSEGWGRKIVRSLAALSLPGASGGSESMFSADFLTAAPCCRPAVPQGDANSLDRNHEEISQSWLARPVPCQCLKKAF